jgi:hypothetical protein
VHIAPPPVARRGQRRGDLADSLFFILCTGSGVDGLQFELEHISPRLLKLNRFSLMAV